MNQAAWSCNECDTNNNPANDACRNCDAERTVAATAVAQQTRPARQAPARPEFVPSKHLPPLPTKLTPTAPPAAPRTPTPPRAPSGTGRRVWWVLFWTVLVIGLLYALAAIGNALPDDFGSAPEQPAGPVAVACPADVADWLPDPAGAELMASYTSPSFAISVCRTSDDTLYYDGRFRDRPVSTDTRISIPATATASGFVAENGGYRYEITGADVVVSENGVVIRQESLTRTGP